MTVPKSVSIAGILLGIISLLVAITVFRAIVYFPTPLQPLECALDKGHNSIEQSGDLLGRFLSALKFKTITSARHTYDTEELGKYVNFISESFPAIHSSPYVKYEQINNYSLLYTITGSDLTLKPYMLCAHLDVVPVERENWNYDPFGGQIVDGFIYGRGTIDAKNIVMGILEALEFELKQGFKPKRSFYIAFGHDEEANGLDGAANIAKTLTQRGVRLEFLLDEGMRIFNQSYPGVENLVAMVAVTEKGYLTLEMTASGEVGHSSMAPPETSIVTLAKAISKFDSSLHPNLFGSGLEWDIFEQLACYASYPYKLVYSNLWLTGPIFSRVLSWNPVTNALIRTTTAVTIINGGFKENVVPSTATATINHRIHPTQTVKEIIEADRKQINDDRIKIKVVGGPIEPHPVSPYDNDAVGFQTVKKSLSQIYPGIAVIPWIMIGSTDTRWYMNMSEAMYRFSPTVLYPEDAKRIHGHNERITITNYVKTVNFYHHIILNSDKVERIVKKNVKEEL